MNVDTGELREIHNQKEMQKALQEGFEPVPKEHNEEALKRLSAEAGELKGQDETKKGDVHINWQDQKSGLIKWGHKKRRIKDRLRKSNK